MQCVAAGYDTHELATALRHKNDASCKAYYRPTFDDKASLLETNRSYMKEKYSFELYKN